MTQNGQNLINFVGRLSVNAIHKIFQTYSNVNPRITYDEISRKVNQLIGTNPFYLNDNIVNAFVVTCQRQQKNYVKTHLYKENKPELCDFLHERFVSGILNYLFDLQKGKDILSVKMSEPPIADQHLKQAEINFGQPGIKVFETDEKIHIVLENPDEMLHEIQMKDPEHHKKNFEIMLKKYFETNYPNIPFWRVHYFIFVDEKKHAEYEKDRKEFEEWKKNKNFI